MIHRKKHDFAEEVSDFNKWVPEGTPVRYWTGPREGEGKLSKTRSEACVVPGMAVVWVEGHSACIALSHIKVIS